jgi:hypothetical protein
MSIADHMLEIMREQGFDIVWYGDLGRIEECARRSGMYDKEGDKHPLAINNRVLSALERSGKFEKRFIKHIGRPARCFVRIDNNKCGEEVFDV